MIRRILDPIRRWWYGDNRGVHARPRRYVEFIDLTHATILRKPVNGRPPWETAPMPTICLFPQSAAPARFELAPGPEPQPADQAVVDAALQEISRAVFGTDSVAEYFENLFGPLSVIA